MIENQRIRLTKKMLKDSLLVTMKKKNIQNISIKEICELAQVNRSTFYKYYGTEIDLLKDLENVHIQKMQEFLKYEDSKVIIIKFLTYIEENIEVFKLFLENSYQIDFLEKTLSICFLKMDENESIFIKYENIKKQKYMYDFIVFGCISIITKWISNTSRETPEEIKEIIFHLISKFFKK